MKNTKKSWGQILWTLFLIQLPGLGLCQEYSLEENVGTYLREVAGDADIPGMSIVLIYQGKDTIINLGNANKETGEEVNSQTLFQLGSTTKAFTGLAITDLEQAGELGLDDPVSSYLPWFTTFHKGKHVSISLRQLLHHTSGIPWNTISKIPESNAKDALERTVRTLIGQELEAEPGDSYEYATINYDVLALVIEQVTGRSYESYMQELLQERLGLSHSNMGIPTDSSLMSMGYKIGFFSARPYDAPVYKGNNAAGYLITNAVDIKHWLKLNLGLLSSELQESISLTHQRDKSVALHGMHSYARGWDVSLEGNGQISHEGLNPNFSSYFSFRKDEKLGVAVLANSNSTYTSVIGNRLMKILAGEEITLAFDPGDRNDSAYSILCLIASLYFLIVMGFLGLICKDIYTGKRKFAGYSANKILTFAKGLLFILPFLLGIYLLPKTIAGFTWESVLVWSPGSFFYMLAAILCGAVISYFTYFLSLGFPEPNEYKRKAPLIILLSLLSGLANMTIIILVTSAIGLNVETRYLVFYYVLVSGMYLLGRVFVQINLIKITRGLIYDMRIRLIQKIFSTSYDNFERMDRGRVYTALNDDVSTLGQSTNLIVGLLTSVITAIGAFLYLASIAFWATLVTIGLIVSLASIYSFVSQRTNRYFEEARDERNTFMRLIEGMMNGYKELSLHRNKKLAYKDDVAHSAEELKEKVSTADIRFVKAFMVGESLFIVLLGLLAFAIPEMFPEIELFTVMSFVIVLLYLIGPINAILGAIPGVMRVRIAWNRLHGFLDDIPATQDLTTGPKSVARSIDSIRTEGLTFTYENEQEEKAFEVGPINFEAKAGEIIFLIGGNGSGKTTFAKLLTGLYQAHQGSIYINNLEMKGADVSEYFSSVFTPPHLFEKLYDIDVAGRQEEVEDFLNLLRLEEKVEIKDNRYSTIDLSGGQRKRLALLQCYLEDSPIYLFDEWAADQDPEYRKFFYRTLLPEIKAQNKIVIAITHDDHYFDAADRVYKMNEGQLEPYQNEYAFLTVDSKPQI